MPRGRPAFQPTDEQRRQVEAFAAYGIRQDDMVKLITWPDGRGIDEGTLRRAFRHELDTGSVKANARVAESLFRQAVGAPAQYDKDGKLLRAEQQPVVSAAIYWTKVRMGWKESDDLNLKVSGEVDVNDIRTKLADRLSRLAAGARKKEGTGEADAG